MNLLKYCEINENTHNMQQTDHAFPLFANAQKPNARKSGKARRLLLSVSHNLKISIMKIEELYKTDFGGFFNIQEQKREPINNHIEFHFKTGGFQDFVDLFFITDNNETIKNAKLTVRRDWLESPGQSIFGLDIIKSFVNQFSQNHFTEPLVEALWRLGREKITLNDDNHIYAMNVILGENEQFSYQSNKSTFSFSNVYDDEIDTKILTLSFQNI